MAKYRVPMIPVEIGHHLEKQVEIGIITFGTS
jgi:hypothetical protein